MAERESVIKKSSNIFNSEQLLDDTEVFNSNELRHLAVNYAITCMKGYKGSFEKWYIGLDISWRTIANRQH